MEGLVEARVNNLPVRVPTDKLGVRSRLVAPRAAQVIAFLENDDVQAFALELAGGG